MSQASAEGARFEPALKDGRPLTVFPEGQLPAWWNDGEPVPTEPDLPRDLLLARWAPEIFELSGQLVLFYTARDRQGLLRSAYATASCIEGPWKDRGPLDVNPRVKTLAPDYPGGPAGAWRFSGARLRAQLRASVSAACCLRTPPGSKTPTDCRADSRWCATPLAGRSPASPRATPIVS